MDMINLPSQASNYSPVLRLASEALTYYSTGKIYDIKPLSGGFANINLRAYTEQGQYLIRICRKQPLENIKKEMQLMEVLKKYNYPAAYPVVRTDGQMITFTGSLPVVVYNFIHGHAPESTTEVIRQIACALMKLHSIPASEVPRKDNVITPEKCFKRIQEQNNDYCMTRDTKTMWIEAFEKTKKFLDIPLPSGLIHGDLFRDNTLFSEGHVAAILDFEEFAIDHFLFDIGMTINGFCITGNLPDRKKIIQFLTAYEQYRPLTEEENNCLDAYTGWTALGMACWHVGDCRTEQKPGQTERIRALTERAWQWLK